MNGWGGGNVVLVPICQDFQPACEVFRIDI